ncbi:MAG: hypothetical protein LBQ50_04365 [Planctomycetaceae bacterium]|nr:hypothetical protein [Planctomycetaceae bacterium]
MPSGVRVGEYANATATESVCLPYLNGLPFFVLSDPLPMLTRLKSILLDRCGQKKTSKIIKLEKHPQKGSIHHSTFLKSSYNYPLFRFFGEQFH